MNFVSPGYVAKKSTNDCHIVVHTRAVRVNNLEWKSPMRLSRVCPLSSLDNTHMQHTHTHTHTQPLQHPTLPQPIQNITNRSHEHAETNTHRHTQPLHLPIYLFRYHSTINSSLTYRRTHTHTEHAHALTHSLTHSLTRSLTYLLTYILTY